MIANPQIPSWRSEGNRRLLAKKVGVPSRLNPWPCLRLYFTVNCAVAVVVSVPETPVNVIV